MDEKCTQLWQKLSAALKPHVSADTFKRWFSAVELAAVTPKALSFRVPNNIYQYWIESNHMAALEAAVLTALGESRQIEFISSESPVDHSERRHHIEAESFRKRRKAGEHRFVWS